MRMMKNNDNETVMVIGIDHGYGNMKTAPDVSHPESPDMTRANLQE